MNSGTDFELIESEIENILGGDRSWRDIWTRSKAKAASVYLEESEKST